MAFYSPKANAMIKSVGYNPRPPNLENFMAFHFSEANAVTIYARLRLSQEDYPSTRSCGQNS